MNKPEYEKFMILISESENVLDEFENAINSNADSVKDNYYLDNAEKLQKISALVKMVNKKKDELHDDISSEEMEQLVSMSEHIDQRIKQCMEMYYNSTKESLEKGLEIPVVSDEALNEQYQSNDGVKAMIDSFVTQQPFEPSKQMKSSLNTTPQAHSTGGTKIDDIVQNKRAVTAAMSAAFLTMPKALIVCFEDGTSFPVFEDRTVQNANISYNEITEAVANIIATKPNVKHQVYKITGQPCSIVSSYSLKF